MFRGKKRKYFFIFCLVTTSFMYSMTYLSVTHSPETLFSGNYFDPEGTKEILIDLPGCKIPWERKPGLGDSNEDEKPICDRNRPKFTYVERNKIFIYSTALEQDISCCYKGIFRVFGNDNNYVVNTTCVKIDPHDGTEVITFSTIVVVCDLNGRVYDDYHFVVQSSGHSLQNPEAPNIVIFGLDSVSRYHFHTRMSKTRKYLQSLGTFELLGYTKVGENTFPNAIAFLTGFKEEQTLKFCYNRSRPIDNCPFIWQNMKMNTAFMEDGPHLSIFNYLKFGFLQPPTDHYLRPLMLLAGEEYYPMNNLFPCVGSRTTEEFVLQSISQLLKYEQPLFSFSWLTSLAHEGPELLGYGDDLISSWLPTLNLSNTILVMMADHGHRYGADRPSFNGWYNDKLPFFTITFPEKVKERLGKERLEALESNTRKLTTPFDFYYTLVDILKIYNLKDFEEATDNVRNHLNDTQDHVIQRLHGQSLLTPIPSNRDCNASGIPREFCACTNFQPMSIHDPIVEEAARAMVADVNAVLPRRCRQLELSQIVASAKVSDDVFIVGLVVKPGNFQYEAYFPFKGKLKSFRTQRTNKISGVWCVNDWFYEYYCYCDLFGYFSEFILGNKYKKP